VLSEDDYLSHANNHDAYPEGPTNQHSSPSHQAQVGDGQQPPGLSFVASVQLSPSQLQDFLYVDGHFVYLQPRGGLARTAYDLQAVDHTKVGRHILHTHTHIYI
jgi:hypothetical protein